MKAIQTKIIPCTNTKPTRIKVSAEGCPSTIVSKSEIEDQLLQRGLLVREETIHHFAASRYAQVRGWLDKCHLVSGGYGDGVWFHCFAQDS